MRDPRPDTVIDLRARTRGHAIASALGPYLLGAFALVLLVELFVGRESMAVRIVAGVVAALILLLLLAGLLTRNRSPRWLRIDHEGLRITNRRHRDVARFAWSELAGVGMMTNEWARRRKLFAASLEISASVQRRMVSVPIWLEVFPAGPEDVRRHPELAVPLALGTRPDPGWEQRWMFLIGDGRGQDLPVGEHVQRWRPDLWRGHRAGSVLFG